jgi:hypothetical protein
MGEIEDLISRLNEVDIQQIVDSLNEVNIKEILRIEAASEKITKILFRSPFSEN